MENSGLKGYDVFIIGLGFVGLTLAVKLSSSGINVRGVEKDAETFKKLELGKPHFYENGLAELLEEVVTQKKLIIERTISDHMTKIRKSRIYILTIGTPITLVKDDSGNIIENFVVENIDEFRHGDILMLRSTVAVGTCDKLICLFEKSNKQVHLSFCPERTVEGVALDELSTLPQIISASHHSALETVRQLFDVISTTVEVPSMKDAELSKLICNVQRDVQFAFANEVLELTQKLGCNFSEVRNACNLNYPRSNLSGYGPVAGPCLEKDAYILAEALRFEDRNEYLFALARKKNENFIARVAHSLDDLNVEEKQKVGIMGLAFKGTPPTDDLRGSYVFNVVDYFLERNKKVMIFDNIVDVDYFMERYSYSDKVEACNDPKKFIKENDILILQNDSRQIKFHMLEKFLDLRDRPLLFLSMVPLERLYSSSEAEYLSNMKNLQLLEL